MRAVGPLDVALAGSSLWQTRRVLLMKPWCECCDRALPPDSTEAVICSIECTWCSECAHRCLGDRCPNCGGILTQRPTRVGALLERNPASTERVHQPGLHRDA